MMNVRMLECCEHVLLDFMTILSEKYESTKHDFIERTARQALKMANGMIDS